MHHEIDPPWKYDPESLFHVYVEWFPIRWYRIMDRPFIHRWPNSSDLLLRVRYLLSQASSEIIRDLFQLRNKHYYKNRHHFDQGGSVAAWLAGLQQDQRWWGQIKDMIFSDDFYLDSVLCIPSLLLYDDPESALILTQFLKKIQDKDLSWGGAYNYLASWAIVCLRRLDTVHEIGLAAEYDDFPINNRVNKEHVKFFNWSKVIRAGIKPGPNMRRELLQLIHETAVPLHHLNGLIHPFTLNHFDPPESLEEATHLKVFETLRNAIKEGYRKTGRFIIPDEHKALYYHWNPEKKPRESKFNEFGPRPLCKAVLTWLDAQVPDSSAYSGTQSSEKWVPTSAPLPNELYHHARHNENLIDLFGALEIDVFCRLPVQVITLMFENIHRLMGPNIWAYEQHALQLLMRGNAYDVKARNLYAEAAKLNEKYDWLEKPEEGEYWYDRYPMLKAPSS